MPKGLKEPIANELILEKYRTLTGDIMIVMTLEKFGDVSPLIDLIGLPVNSTFA